MKLGINSQFVDHYLLAYWRGGGAHIGAALGSTTSAQG
jgi:hypothetical protein